MTVGKLYRFKGYWKYVREILVPLAMKKPDGNWSGRLYNQIDISEYRERILCVDHYLDLKKNDYVNTFQPMLVCLVGDQLVVINRDWLEEHEISAPCEI
jgi:hypothetical protein